MARQPNLTVHITRDHGLVTVTLNGDVDVGAVPRLREAIRTALRLARHTVVVDTSEVAFVDLAGRRALSTDGYAVENAIRLLILNGPVLEAFDRRLRRLLLTTEAA